MRDQRLHAVVSHVGVRVQDSLQLSIEKKRRIVENRRQLLLNLEQLLRKQNMVRAAASRRSTPVRPQADHSGLSSSDSAD